MAATMATMAAMAAWAAWGLVAVAPTPSRADALDDLVAYALDESIALDRLAEMTDVFGPRLSGTQALEDVRV